jgi:kexin
VRILSGDITDMDEALAINYEMQKNDIYSCSWGPPDDGKTMQAPDILIEKAMVNAVQKGRGGKGFHLRLRSRQWRCQRRQLQL